MDYFPKNGAYIQARKQYTQIPFHNNHSHLSLVFDPKNQETEQLKRLKFKDLLDHENVKKAYEQQVEKMLQQKCYGKRSISQAMSIDSRQRKEEDTLAKQLEEFNSSKMYAPQVNHHYPEPQKDFAQEKNNSNYMRQLAAMQYNRQQEQLNYRPGLQKRYETIQPNQSNYYHHQINENSSRNKQFLTQNKMRNINYSNHEVDLQKQYRKYAEVTKGIPTPDHLFKNVIPDKLQHFLRLNVKADHRRSMDVTVAPNNRNKHAK